LHYDAGQESQTSRCGPFVKEKAGFRIQRSVRVPPCAAPSAWYPRISRRRRHECFFHIRFLMIAILRSNGVPARSVSGSIHRPNKESRSHAWCEVWLPDMG
jgi:hypothetical protein